MSRIVSITGDLITFDDGAYLRSDHETDCCEYHWLDFGAVEFDEVSGLDFRLNSEGSFFQRVDGYGIRLLPTNGHPVSIAGYGSNNGYYSGNIDLVLVDSNGSEHRFDVSECQTVND